jgi:hydrogenase nickel incorporation protein HypA/HybF
MHELSIARTIVETARAERRAQGRGSLKAIGLRIGALAGVVTDSLEFCFEAVTKDTDLEGCSLEVDHLPVRATCSDCGRSFEVEGFIFTCPGCGSGAVDVTQGYELEIAYLEVDDAPPTPELPNQGVYNVNENSA